MFAECRSPTILRLDTNNPAVPILRENQPAYGNGVEFAARVQHPSHDRGVLARHVPDYVARDDTHLCRTRVVSVVALTTQFHVVSLRKRSSS